MKLTVRVSASHAKRNSITVDTVVIAGSSVVTLPQHEVAEKWGISPSTHLLGPEGHAAEAQAAPCAAGSDRAEVDVSPRSGRRRRRRTRAGILIKSSCHDDSPSSQSRRREREQDRELQPLSPSEGHPLLYRRRSSSSPPEHHDSQTHSLSRATSRQYKFVTSGKAGETADYPLSSPIYGPSDAEHGQGHAAPSPFIPFVVLTNYREDFRR